MIIWFCIFQNNSLVVTKLEVNSLRLPKEFDGYVIVHLSDLHNKNFGKNQQPLINIVKKVNPDIIVITGDLVDRRLYNDKPALKLLKQITEISDVYFVSGNHEWKSGRYNTLRDKIRNCGAIILSDDYKEIKKKGQSIYILGVDDPSKYSNKKLSLKMFGNSLKTIINRIDSEKFKILLAHRPDLIEIYSSCKLDVVFSGHAHGGQVRLPIIGGLFVPNQGLFPKYTAGIYNMNRTSMVVSRGLGNSSIAPQRIFNRPEVIVLTLRKQ